MKEKIFCYDKDGNKKKYDVKELSFRPSVYGILVEDNKVILHSQWDGYDLPGGGMEKSETIEEALKREFFEETGIIVEPLNLIACKSSFFVLPYWNKPVNSILIYYLCKKIKDKGFSRDNLSESEKEWVKKEPQWIDLKEIGNIKFYSSVDLVKIINKAVKINKCLN